MSEQSIYDKSLVIRNETQQYANTRGRVADVLDDINATKANKTDVDAAIQVILDELGITESELYAYIDARNAEQNIEINKKVDKPLGETGSTFYILSNIEGVITWEIITATEGQIPKFSGTSFSGSVIFEDETGQIGIGTITPEHELQVAGYIKSDAYVYESTAKNSIPNKTWTDGEFLYFTDELGENHLLSFSPDKILTLGAITATTTTIDLAVHSSGVNSVQLGGEVLSKNTADHWEFAEVTDEEVFQIYAISSAEIFHLALDGDELPEGALVVATITISEHGVVVEDLGNKLFADDTWRTINNATANFISIGNNRSGSFHLVNSADVLGFATKVGKYVWQGRDFVFYCDADTTFKNSTYTDTLEVKHFTFFADYEVKAGNYAWFKEKNGELVQISVGGGSDDTKLDKPLSPNNISTRVVNADNSTSDKGEFQQSEQIEIGTNTTAQASWRGKEVWVTASCTLTIPDPATLPAFWSIDVYVIAGTLTHAITSPATWLGTTPANAPADSFYRIVRRGSTNSFKVLGL